VKPGKTGPKLMAHANGPPCDVPTDSVGNRPPWKEGDVFPPVCYRTILRQTSHHQWLVGARNTTMSLIAATLASLGRLGRPVVDETGLTGTFDFTMECLAPEATPGAAPDPDAEGPTFLEAVREQLGLKLEPMKVEMDVLVVDHVEEPSEN
jgi:bla regulator protein blaR1